ncbi:MAG TPA: TrpB-like pyridoxal phosphate-dependent enzyme [Candidatus Methanoperedens sp.]|nr:TrpB-like pyridoxal phosphate-dependent enzyme [Candidatus Methanoperedens sp.]
MSETKIILSEREMPAHWYNILPDMPSAPAPPLHPGTGKPVGPDDLKAIFPMSLIEQEMSPQREIPIPEEVREIYTLWRPSPLFRAKRLEQTLKTPARIYYKYEGNSPAGSHKPNTAVPQAFYNKAAGIRRIATETGAGQWGSAMSLACQMFGLECTVYMVKVSYEQKPYRRSMMATWGAEVIPSPSNRTNAGRAMLAAHPHSTGSLGGAISEAVEDAATRQDTNYALGSVLNHVLLHQTVIGLETKAQLAKAGEKADVLIACVGGGSNFGGFTFPFVRDKAHGDKVRIVAVEPKACPTLTRGKFGYDFGDVAKLTPMMLMYTLGHDFTPASIHAGGLRYHGDSPLVSQLVHEGIVEAVAYHQNPVFEAAVTFARHEGIIPAPESAHAIKAAIDEAVKAREAGEKRVIVFNLSGHGHFDMSAYDNYFAGKLEDFELPQSDIDAALRGLPQVGA